MPYRFRDARIQSEKNLAEAAEELFVSKTTLSNWESGRRVLPRVPNCFYAASTDLRGDLK